MVCMFVGFIGLGKFKFVPQALGTFSFFPFSFLNNSHTEPCFSILGRVYLGMHSVVDIIGGLAFGLAILAFWIYVHEYIDSFIISGPNGRMLVHNLFIIFRFYYFFSL